MQSEATRNWYWNNECNREWRKTKSRNWYRNNREWVLIRERHYQKTDWGIRVHRQANRKYNKTHRKQKTQYQIEWRKTDKGKESVKKDNMRRRKVKQLWSKNNYLRKKIFNMERLK